MEGQCLSCDLFQTWEGVTQSYSREALALLSAEALPFLSAAALLYGAIECGRYVARQDLVWGDIAKNVLMLAFVSAALTSSSLWWEWIVSPFFETAIALAVYLASLGGADVGRGGLAGLMAAIEAPAFRIVDNARVLNKQEGGVFPDLGLFLSTAFLFVVYAYLWIQVCLGLIWSYTKFVITTALGPIILVAAAIPPTRKTAVNALKILTVASLEIVLSGILCGIAATVLHQARVFSPVDDANNLKQSAEDFIFSSGYLALLFVAFCLIVVESKFKGYAASLGDAWDSQAARFSVAQASRAATQVARTTSLAAKQTSTALSAAAPQLAAAAKALAAVTKKA